jgi:ceramide glucosyltransferase
VTLIVIALSPTYDQSVGMIDAAAGVFCALATLAHLASTAVALILIRNGARTPAWFARGPAVSLIRPVRGLENHIEATLRSSFMLAYRNYELLFCVADADDPVIPLIERLIADYPQVSADILIGDDRISGNPKLNNMVKGMRAARHHWLLFADSNVLMPKDYIERTLAAWRVDAGLICSPPAGCLAAGWWAQVEAAFLNGYQARWQYVADAVGVGFAQGKTMLWRRTDLERIGGLAALAAETAEDAAATKAVRAQGLRVRLVAPPFPQPLGFRSFTEMWRRQARWAQLRRASFPHYFALEILTGAMPPLIAAGFAATSGDVSVAAIVAALAFAWYGCELLLVRTAGWQLTPLSPLAWIARDLLIPAIWVHAWFAADFVWRGNPMQTRERRPIAQAARDWVARFRET